MLDCPGLIISGCRDLYIDVFGTRLPIVGCEGVGCAVVVD